MKKLLWWGLLLILAFLALTAIIIAAAPYLAIGLILAIVGYKLLSQEKDYSGEEDGTSGKDEKPP